MSHYQQMEMYPELAVERMSADIESIKVMMNNTRRGLFGRQDEIHKKIRQLELAIEGIVSQRNHSNE